MGWFNEALGLSPIKTTNVDTSEYSSMGKDFLNPNSSRNRGMYNNLKQMGVDAIAQQYLNGARMGAMGQNPFANQQMRSGLSNNLAQTQQAYNGYLNNAYTTGSGLMGQALQGDMANAQAQNMANMQAAQNKSQFYGGLLASATQALPFALFGMPGGGTRSGAGSGAGNVGAMPSTIGIGNLRNTPNWRSLSDNDMMNRFWGGA